MNGFTTKHEKKLSRPRRLEQRLNRLQLLGYDVSGIVTKPIAA
jgi:hypothetical protein